MGFIAAGTTGPVPPSTAVIKHPVTSRPSAFPPGFEFLSRSVIRVAVMSLTGRNVTRFPDGMYHGEIHPEGLKDLTNDSTRTAALRDFKDGEAVTTSDIVWEVSDKFKEVRIFGPESDPANTFVIDLTGIPFQKAPESDSVTREEFNKVRATANKAIPILAQYPPADRFGSPVTAATSYQSATTWDEATAYRFKKIEERLTALERKLSGALNTKAMVDYYTKFPWDKPTPTALEQQGLSAEPKTVDEVEAAINNPNLSDEQWLQAADAGLRITQDYYNKVIQSKPPIPKAGDVITAALKIGQTVRIFTKDWTSELSNPYLSAEQPKVTDSTGVDWNKVTFADYFTVGPRVTITPEQLVELSEEPWAFVGGWKRFADRINEHFNGGK